MITGNYAATGRALVDWLKQLANEEPNHPAGTCSNYSACLVSIGAGEDNIFRDGVRVQMRRMYAEYGKSGANMLKTYLASQLDSLTGKRYGVDYWSTVFQRDQADGYAMYQSTARTGDASAEISRISRRVLFAPSPESTPTDVAGAALKCSMQGGQYNPNTDRCIMPSADEDIVGGSGAPDQGMLLDSDKNYQVLDPSYEQSVIGQLSQFWVTSSGQNPNGSSWYYLTGGGPPDPSSPISGAQVVRGSPDTLGVVVSLDVNNPELYKLVMTSSEVDASAETTAGSAAKAMNPGALLYPPFDMAPFVLRVPAGGWTDVAPDPQPGPMIRTDEAKRAAMVVAGGGLLALAVVGGGIYYVTKKRKKRAVPNRWW